MTMGMEEGERTMRRMEKGDHEGAPTQQGDHKGRPVGVLVCGYMIALSRS